MSKQIDALCDDSPVLAPARFKKHRTAAAAREEQLRLEVSSLRKQLAGSQVEVRQLKQQLLGSQAESQQLQQQLSGQQL